MCGRMKKTLPSMSPRLPEYLQDRNNTNQAHSSNTLLLWRKLKVQKVSSTHKHKEIDVACSENRAKLIPFSA